VTLKEVNLSIYKKISSNLRNSRGEDRAAELKARIEHSRRSRPSIEERQKSLRDSRVKDREQVYKTFIQDSLSTPKAVKSKAADRLNEIMGKVIIEEEEVRHAIATRTGILSLDHNLGGGLPSGFIEIYGSESVGKTTLLSRIISATQKMGKQVMMTSTEFFDAPYFKKSGVDLNKLLMIRSEEGHIVLEAAYQLIKSIPNMVYVIDSATGLRPPVDEYGNWIYMFKDWIEEVSTILDVGSCVVIVNQVRARKSLSPGKFFAGGTDSVARKVSGLFSTRLELFRTSVTDTTYDMVVNIVANTLKAPAKIFSLPVIKGMGIDVDRDLVQVASVVSVLKQRGTWYYLDDYQLGQGESEVGKQLSNNEELRDIVEQRTLRTLVRGEGP